MVKKEGVVVKEGNALFLLAQAVAAGYNVGVAQEIRVYGMPA